MRRFLLAILLGGSCSLPGAPAAADWTDTPLCIVSEKVELYAGRELTLVSGRLMLQYLEQEDEGHRSRILVHYPLYVERGPGELHDIVEASNIKLQMGDLVLEPVAGGIVSAGLLSDEPIPEDADVAFVTFEIPRELATLRFEVLITHVQPNFHYRGARLSAFTPWLPKFIQYGNVVDSGEGYYEVAIQAGEGVAIEKFPSDIKVKKQSSTGLVAYPEHRKTIAVEILPVGEASKP